MFAQPQAHHALCPVPPCPRVKLPLLVPTLCSPDHRGKAAACRSVGSALLEAQGLLSHRQNLVQFWQCQHLQVGLLEKRAAALLALVAGAPAEPTSLCCVLCSNSSLCCVLCSSSRPEMALVLQSIGSHIKPQLLHSPTEAKWDLVSSFSEHAQWFWDGQLCIDYAGCF